MQRCWAWALGAAVACSVMLLRPAAAHAEVRPAVEGVACVPGGVAAVPLQRQEGDAWPSTVPVQVGGLDTQGVVVWVAPRRDNGARYWTRTPDQVDVQPVEQEPPPGVTAQVLALVELPALVGELRVCGVKIEANWLTAAPPPVGGAASMPWPQAPVLDLPDPESPSEYWRWCLLAQSRGQAPPPPHGTAVERLWARHAASLWAAGMERVRLASAGVHRALLDALVGTAQDPALPPPSEVGAWIADPMRLRALLAVLLDASVHSDQLAQSALSWLRAHRLVTVWVESDAGDRVQFAAANPTAEEAVVRLAWVGEEDPVSQALLVPPHHVARMWVDRPPLQASADPVPMQRMRPERIELTVGDNRHVMDIGPREYAVRPPGLSFGTLLPPLSLADAQASVIAPPPPVWRATAQLRRRQGRWELLVECMHPANEAEGEHHPDGEDEITFRLGDPQAPVRTVRVAGDGRLAVDGGPDDGASAGFMRWQDRWRARIELPDAWIPSAAVGLAGSSRPMVFSLERSPGRGLPRQAAVLAVPEWLRCPPAVIADLSTWSDAVVR